MVDIKPSVRTFRSATVATYVALHAVLSGCGIQPVIDAGVDQTVSEGETVTLSAVNGSTASLTNFIWE